MRNGIFKTSNDDRLRRSSLDGYNVIDRRAPSDRPKATLYLVEPRNKPDAIIRPLEYNFTPGFIDEIVDNVRSARNASIGSGGIGTQEERAFLRGMRDSQEAILPSNNAYRFGRKTINDLYRIILVVENAPIAARSKYSPAGKNRVSYTGICKDDPISRSGHLNLECAVEFVNMSHVDIMETADSSGYRGLGKPRLNLDIIPRMTLDYDSNSTTDRDNLLAPEFILDSIINTEDDGANAELYRTTVMRPDVTTLSQSPQAKVVRSSHNAPRAQLNRITTGLVKAILDSDNDRNFRSVTDREFSEIALPRDAFLYRSRFRSALGGSIAQRVAGPEYYKTITLAKLTDLYPEIENNAKVLSVDDADYSLLDEEITNPLTLMSSHIKASVPGILADHGLDSVTFRYATSDPTAQRFRVATDDDYVLDVHKADPFVEESNRDTRDRVEQAILFIREQVFADVEHIVGEIEVFIDYRSGEDTLVQLQLREHTDVINYDVAVQHGDLGGMASTLVGGPDEYDHASETISSLLDIIDSEAGNRFNDRRRLDDNLISSGPDGHRDDRHPPRRHVPANEILSSWE